ncbi:DUF859 family phage minor structural protein [Evansella tamaricis]|uniref:DUF859 domain-containing protein n=1 Tax=Evansella tamaricis TaxID=2069301 RepID=A0ABS6JBJ7_9BACI|nr:DUF859 family phage minor structural protein [Evansella tamaricis]MBU9711049.1 DUF859 domain-containing protein [Evansella tamaricis]
MASGTITGSYTRTYYRIEIEWTSTPDVDNNRSSVTARVYLRIRDSGRLNFSANKNGNTTINGSSSNWSYGSGVNGGAGRYLLHTRTINVSHDSDGKKRCRFDAWFDVNVTLSSGWMGRLSAGGTVDLDDIPRGVNWIRASGSWRKGQNWIRASGSWRKAIAVWVRAGGSWRRSK